MSTRSIIRVCHVVPSINEHTGGPAVSVPSLTANLTRTDVTPLLFCLNYPQHGLENKPAGVELCSITATPFAMRFRGYSNLAGERLKEFAQTSSIIHNHGLWMFPNIYARQAASVHGIPLVISPRGMLESWSMSNSRLKKKIAYTLYERKNLESADAFHATAQQEVESIRAMGLHQPIVKIPNGVDIPAAPVQCNRDALEKVFPQLRGKKWLLFISRLHPKKGLDILLETWSELVGEHSDFCLLVAGSDAPGYEEKFQEMARNLNLEQHVVFTGNLSGAKKAAALSCSELMVLPTHSENFGIVVAESLAHETPVICTKGAPWSDLQSGNCGWWIEIGKQPLIDCMRTALALPPEERSEMGKRGRSLVEQNYSWEKMANRMAAFYHWLVDGDREQPEDVIL